MSRIKIIIDDKNKEIKANASPIDILMSIEMLAELARKLEVPKELIIFALKNAIKKVEDEEKENEYC